MKAVRDYRADHRAADRAFHHTSLAAVVCSTVNRRSLDMFYPSDDTVYNNNGELAARTVAKGLFARMVVSGRPG